jgi:hypothetical protein
MKVLIVISILLAVIIFDLAVYLVLGMLLMNYHDFYDESEGEYWSLSSMTMSEKATYIVLNVWHVVNLMVVGYIIFGVVRKFWSYFHVKPLTLYCDKGLDS